MTGLPSGSGAAAPSRTRVAAAGGLVGCYGFPERIGNREHGARLLGLEPQGVELLAEPNLALATWSGHTRVPRVTSNGPVTACLFGSARWTGDAAADPGVRLVQAYLERGLDGVFAKLRGDFALVLIDRSRNRVALAVDRVGIQRLCYAATARGIVFGDSVQVVARSSLVAPKISRQALLGYLYFHVIPSPGTVLQDVAKVEPAAVVVWENGSTSTKTYWQPQFDSGGARAAAEAERDLIPTLEGAVRRQNGAHTAAFLSGGIDSSTVVGLMKRVQGPNATSFTVGFDEPGYDEREYAEISAKHFGVQLRHHLMKPQDVSGLLLDIVHSLDEPFGNSSIVPAYACASTARAAGFTRLLAGDGGDELFGGNTRYGTQNLFEVFWRLPGALRTMLKAGAKYSGPLGRVPGVSKVVSYIRQASVPLPARLQTYNYLERLGFEAVLHPSFQRTLDVTRPAAELKQRYEAVTARSVVDLLLHLDWKFTLADNDLRKVAWACERAAIEVAYPWLDDEVIDLSTRVPGPEKVAGTRLRVMVRRAMRGFLAEGTLTKSKHGFGLPFGLWMKRDPALRAMIQEALASLRDRQIVRAEHIAELVSLHEHEHAAYYGEFIWVLACLELWLQSSSYPMESA